MVDMRPRDMFEDIYVRIPFLLGIDDRTWVLGRDSLGVDSLVILEDELRRMGSG
jgi:hypothetical protein